jgi:hypothetical protein
LKIIKNVAKEPDLYLTLYIIYTLISKAHLWIIL